jgi:hypothetical protein
MRKTNDKSSNVESQQSKGRLIIIMIDKDVRMKSKEQKRKQS